MHLSKAGGADSMLVFENTSGTNPFQVGQGNDDSLRFYHNLSEKMRIKSDGKIGIGSTAPQSVLHVSHATAPTFRLSRTGTGQIWVQQIDSSGRLHIQ